MLALPASLRNKRSRTKLKLFRILTARKLEREQKLDEAGDGRVFALARRVFSG